MRLPPELAQTLAVTVEHGSLEAAARALHVTQSAVSQRLQTLERLAGQVLLVRSRPVRATPAGEVVIRFARQVAQLDEQASASLGIAEGRRPAIAIGVNADSLATWFLPPLARLSTRHGVTFELHRDDEGRTADLLAKGTVVAAVTTRREPVPGCTVTPLGSVEYRAVASPEFVERWFAAGVTADALASAPVVDLDSHDTLQTTYLESAGVNPALPPRHRIPASADFVRAIEHSMGWGVLPRPQYDGLDTMVGLGGASVMVSLFWQQWRVHSDLLHEVAAEVVKEAARCLVSPGASL